MIVGSDMGRVLPMAVFGIAAVVASLLSLMLTETKFRRFPDQMGDFEKYGLFFVISASCININKAKTEI